MGRGRWGDGKPLRLTRYSLLATRYLLLATPHSNFSDGMNWDLRKIAHRAILHCRD